MTLGGWEEGCVYPTLFTLSKCWSSDRLTRGCLNLYASCRLLRCERSDGVANEWEHTDPSKRQTVVPSGKTTFDLQNRSTSRRKAVSCLFSIYACYGCVCCCWSPLGLCYGSQITCAGTTGQNSRTGFASIPRTSDWQSTSLSSIYM